MKDRKAVEEELGYVSQLAMNLTGFINITWEWQDDGSVVLFNTADSEGSPADDNWELACLVAKLTGWEVFHITDAMDYNPHDNVPFKVGLRKSAATPIDNKSVL